jgi:hypothetical protein
MPRSDPGLFHASPWRDFERGNGATAVELHCNGVTNAHGTRAEHIAPYEVAVPQCGGVEVSTVVPARVEAEGFRFLGRCLVGEAIVLFAGDGV